MSRGPGRVQLAILALMDSDRCGAWTTTQICRHVYGVDHVDNKHRVAVLRALRGGFHYRGWCLWCGLPGHEDILWNRGRFESCLKANWLLRAPHEPFEAFLHTHPVAKRLQSQRAKATLTSAE